MINKTDIFTLETIRIFLLSISNEMESVVRNTSHSLIFNEGMDFSCSLFRENGDLVSQSHLAVCVHAGAMETASKAMLKTLGPKNLRHGDIIIHNDPFNGGAHLPDVNIYMPVIFDGELAVFPAVRGHWEEVGGHHPGGFTCDAVSIYQEGVIIPPTFLGHEGKLDENVLRLILAQVRTPHHVLGDIRAQVAACKVASRRILEIYNKYGKENVDKSLDYAIDKAEQMVRKEIETWPNGTYYFEDFLDEDGIDRGKEIKIAVELTVDGSDLTFDFSKSSPQVKGAVNMPIAVTTSSVYIAVINAIAPSEGFASDLANHGIFRPLKIISPPGLVTNAQKPVPVVGGNTEGCWRAADTVLGALLQVIPEKLVAGCVGSANNFCCGGVDTRKRTPASPTRGIYAWYQFPPGGGGARVAKDGAGLHDGTIGGATSFFPREAFESEYPWYVEEHAIPNDSGGPGKFRGGMGILWKLRPVEHVAEIGSNADRARIPPYGIFGGMPGLHAEWKIIYDCADAFDPELKGSSVDDFKGSGKSGGKIVRPQDLLYARTPGGGGYGDPYERKPEYVLEDVLDDYVSLEAAERDYGVIIDPKTFKINYEATAKLREKMKREMPRKNIYIDQTTLPYARFPFRTLYLHNLPEKVRKNITEKLAKYGHTVEDES